MERQCLHGRDAPEFARDDLRVLIEVTFPGQATAISPVVDQIMHHVSASCGSAQHDQIELALREALANGVRHRLQERSQQERALHRRLRQQR